MTTARVQNDYILPDNHGGFITISTKRSGFLANPLIFESYAHHYNNRLEPVKNRTFKLNKGYIKGSIKGAFVKENQLSIINLEVNHRKKYISFKKITGNIDNGAINEQEFYKINWIYPKNEVNLFVNLNSLYFQKLKYYSDVNFFNPKIFIKFSKNNNFFGIVYRDTNEQETSYNIVVFDSDFNLRYKSKFSHPVNTKLFYINDIAIDDKDGTAYIIAKIYRTDPLIKNRFINTDNLKKYILYKAGPKRIINISFKPEKVIEKLLLALNDKQLSVYGFFRNRYIDLNDIDGITRINLSTKNLQIKNKSYQKFSKKLVATKYKKNHKKTKNHTMIVRNTFILNDGSLLINAEDMYIPLMMKKKDRETDVREIVGNIFSIKIDPAGNIIWAKKIYKQQIVKPRLALHSYFSCMINDNNYILFTDSRLKKAANNDPFYLNQKDLQNLNGIKISRYGDLQTGIIKENKRSKFRFMPIEGIMINPREVIIPAKDHQYIKFYKLSF
jgi:hypothetical protein